MNTGLSTRAAPRRTALDRATAVRLASTEYERVADLFEALSPADWTAATDCPGWDVRAMAGHMLGMAQMVASLREMLSQQLASTRRQKQSGGLTIDALTTHQVEKNASLAPAEIVGAMRATGVRAARGRRRTPSLVRNRALPEEQDVAGQKEWWTFGYLLDTILTRDPFVHRIDITRATGVPLTLAADHEGAIVDDVVREWATRHGSDYALELSGPAGGSWSRGDAPVIALDAVEFCRVLSGRATGEGLLAVPVPF